MPKTRIVSVIKKMENEGWWALVKEVTEWDGRVGFEYQTGVYKTPKLAERDAKEFTKWFRSFSKGIGNAN